MTRRSPGPRALRLLGRLEIDPTADGWSSALGQHLEYLRWCNLQQRTIDERRTTLGRLVRHAGVDLLAITQEQVSAFRDRPSRSGQPLAQSTTRTELAHLRAFYKWALLEELVERDPMLRVPLPRIPRWLPHPIPEHELAAAIDTARDRIRPFFFLAAYAGLRAIEISKLRADDLWWHQDPPLLVVREGKGGDPGTVPISPILAAELEQLPRFGFLFPKLNGTLGPIRAAAVSHMANDHLHATGSFHTLHSCRHRFGTMVYRLSGGDLRLTQEMMRHKSPVSTAIYTQVDQGAAAGVVSALPAPSRLRAAS